MTIFYMQQPRSLTRSQGDVYDGLRLRFFIGDWGICNSRFPNS
ncbi:MAG: hypothetical protein V7K67_15415 [Nostoc sp.]